MPNAFAFDETVLSFNRDRHLANEESLSSSYSECEEIENERNPLTWGYSKKVAIQSEKVGENACKAARAGYYS